MSEIFHTCAAAAVEHRSVVVFAELYYLFGMLFGDLQISKSVNTFFGDEDRREVCHQNFVSIRQLINEHLSSRMNER